MMRALVLIVFAHFIVNSLGQVPIKEAKSIESCQNTRSIVLAINLVDEECLSKSKNNTSFAGDNENSIEMVKVDMEPYAVCLLKKSSILNKEGEVNSNFDIVKIVKHLYKKTDDRSLGLAFIIKALERCRNSRGNNQSTTAAKIIKCLLDNQETIIWCDNKKF
ncbi:uncharacterized protein LOC106637886 [Copidosoma floridanum]|uniref:uncharacterized protein LOC106637886 n=1 Tax=Copidosoma floridanum TaxID=29053 RepID=UPI000C6FA2D4|nr:uncharacterized protein LOC106637886 [Copidosoma floridanum]